MTQEFKLLHEKMQSRVLSNGMPVYMIPKPQFSRAFAVLATNFGSVDAGFSLDGQRFDTPIGVAHFLEHKMFEDEDGNALQKFGKTGASPNAFTSRTMTAYHFSCDEGFEENLEILLKFVFTPYFTEENVVKERGIIEQEINMIDDTPSWRVWSGLLAGMYHNHPVRESIAGTAESIAQITPELLYTCHKAFYHPANMALVVCGNTDIDAVCKLAQAVSPDKSTAPVSERFYGDRKPCVREEFTTQTMAVSQPQCMIGFKDTMLGEGESHLRRMLLGELAVRVLCGNSTPFYNELYGRGLIAGYLEGTYDIVPQGAYVAFMAEAKDPVVVYEKLRDEVGRLAHGGIDPMLFASCKRALFGMHIRVLDSLGDLARAQVTASFAGETYLNFAAVFETIDVSDLQQMYARWAQPGRSAISVVKPKEEK